MTECSILAKPQPFGEWVHAACPAGLTIRQMLGDAAYSAHVEIGGYEVPQQLWDRVKPKPGTTIRVTVYPQGGNGRKLLRTVAMVALTVWTGGMAAAGWTAFGLSAATTWAIVGMVGMMAINALIPPPSLATGGGVGKQDPYDQLSQLTGTSNQANPYGVIPCVIGGRRFHPPMAALPYTEILGDQQYLRALFDLGHGDLDVSDIQIGGTAIESYGDVEWEVSTNPTLFTQDVFELSVGEPLNSTGSNAIRTTQNPTDEGSVDVAFPQGLFAVNDQGDTVKGTVDIYVHFRKVGDVSWTVVDASTTGLSKSSSAIKDRSGGFKIQGGARKLLRCGIRWKFPTVGQYEVRVGRDTSAWAGSIAQGFRDMTWTTLRSISYQETSSTGTLKLALRAKATGDMQGVVQAVSVYAIQRVRTYDPGTATFGPAVATQNPAWVALWLQTECPANGNRFADERMDLDGYAAWAAECTAKGYRVSHVADSPRPFGEVLRDVFACGRAAFGVRNGKYSVTRDLTQILPAQTFTSENSWDFSYSRSFLPPPHGLRVKFSNPEANYQEDVFTVYADGYTEANATRFEDLDLRLVDDYEAAWKLARYHIMVMWKRPTQYTRMVDYEHLVCEVGDLTHNESELVGWGLATGRVGSAAEVEALGPELMVNGTFDTDISGWSKSGTSPGAVVEWVSPGAMHIQNPGGGSVSADYAPSLLTVGKIYEARFTLSGVVNTIQFMNGGTTLASVNTNGEQVLRFTASATTIRFLRNFPVEATVDNISIREVLSASEVTVNPITLESGKTYKFQVRTASNERYDATITNGAGTHTVLTLDSEIPVEAGDLYAIGEVNKGLASLIVRRIERAGDTTAKLTMVDYAPDVLTADAGTPPPFTSQITGQPWCAPPDPPVVDIRFSDSAPDDGGIVHVQTGISTPPKSGIHRIPIYDIKYGKPPL